MFPLQTLMILCATDIFVSLNLRMLYDRLSNEVPGLSFWPLTPLKGPWLSITEWPVKHVWSLKGMWYTHRFNDI